MGTPKMTFVNDSGGNENENFHIILDVLQIPPHGIQLMIELKRQSQLIILGNLSNHYYLILMSSLSICILILIFYFFIDILCNRFTKFRLVF